MRERSASPAPDSTDQLCATESIRHSTLLADPSGVPSSKYARRYHSPSQPCCSRFWRSLIPSASQRSANAASPLPLRDLGELLQHGVQEEAQPDAFARALDADQVHAVVPVAGAHQRQAVRAELQAVLDGAHAVLVEAGRFRGPARAGRSRNRRPGSTGRPSRNGIDSSSTPVSPVAFT